MGDATSRTVDKGRIYYGWIVAWTAFAVLSISYGVQFSFGVLLPSIVNDLGISRSQASFAFSLYVFVYSAMSAVSGVLTDRRGPRPVLAAGALLLGVGYLLTSQAHQQWQLLIALGLVAGVGMSAAFVPCNATVVRWFLRRRGTALSISTSGGSFAAVVVPFVVGWLSDRVSWRILYGAMGVLAFVTLGVASRLFVRSPEVLGLTVDDEMGGATTAGFEGDSPPSPTSLSAVVEPDVVDHSLAQAARTAVFWIVVGIFLCTWLVVFLPLVHLSPFAKDLGASAGVASTLVSAVGLGGLVGRTTTGAVSDRLGRLASLGIVLTAQIVAFLAFAASHSLLTLYPAAVVFGVGYGGTTTVFPAIVADRFGRAHAGAIVGAIFAGAGSWAAVGPYLAARIYDVTGSYRVAFLLSAAVNLVALALVAVLASAVRRGRRAGEPVADSQALASAAP